MMISAFLLTSSLLHSCSSLIPAHNHHTRQTRLFSTTKPSFVNPSSSESSPEESSKINKDKDSKEDLYEKLNSNFDYSSRITSPSSTYRTGYVSIVGLPNMGKSTLLNNLLQEKLCATTSLPQTTRHSILGIWTLPKRQLLFLDTPGIILDPAYKLQKCMMERVQESAGDADVIVFVTDPEGIVPFDTSEGEEGLSDDLTRLLRIMTFKNVIVAVNKVDLMDSDFDLADNIAKWRRIFPKALAVLPMSASEGKDVGVNALKMILTAGKEIPACLRDIGRPYPGMYQEGNNTITDVEAEELLPLGPALYPEDDLTDRNERFLASETIREALFLNLKREVPYCCEVRVEKFKNGEKLLNVGAVIYVERDSQKGIVVGKGGAMIKSIGVDARVKLEAFYQKKVNLNLSVKVELNWRKNEDRLKDFGYLS